MWSDITTGLRVLHAVIFALMLSLYNGGTQERWLLCFKE